MFVVIEGPDGSGKTTQAKRLADRLRGVTGREVLSIAIPSDSLVGQAARKCLKTGLDWKALFADPQVPPILIQSTLLADCYGTVQQIRNCLRKGGIVVADRWAPSGEVYGVIDGVDHEWLTAAQDSLPVGDINFLLDLDVTCICDRLKGKHVLDVYETESYQRRVVAGYRNLWAMFASKPGGASAWRQINANRSESEVHEDLFRCVIKWHTSAAY